MTPPYSTPPTARRCSPSHFWEWTAAPGIAPYPKYNIRYVSEGVISATSPDDINHKQGHTRKSLIAALLEHPWTDEGLESFLDERGVACVDSTTEHAVLGGSNEQGWERYVEAGVQVYDRAIGQFVDRQTKRASSATEPAAPSIRAMDLGDDAVAREIAAQSNAQVAQTSAPICGARS